MQASDALTVFSILICQVQGMAQVDLRGRWVMSWQGKTSDKVVCTGINFSKNIIPFFSIKIWCSFRLSNTLSVGCCWFEMISFLLLSSINLVSLLNELNVWGFFSLLCSTNQIHSWIHYKSRGTISIVYTCPVYFASCVRFMSLSVFPNFYKPKLCIVA